MTGIEEFGGVVSFLADDIVIPITEKRRSIDMGIPVSAKGVANPVLRSHCLG
ncbi:MAG: hypothetical protein HQL77_18320 [Magnetococcales bacterium]|nr:hypothetical protein [Magnetococcales bacterium]